MYFVETKKIQQMTTETQQNDAVSLNAVLKELSIIKQKLEDSFSIGDWITQTQLKKFLQKKQTSFRDFLKTEDLPYSQIGRKHYFRKQDVINLLEKNIVNNNK
jgi:hypothetical protein